MKKELVIIGIISVAMILIMRFAINNRVCNPPKMVNFEDTTKILPPIPVYMYGLNINDFDVIETEVKKNQNLSSIISQFNIPDTTIQEILITADTLRDFDFRKIRMGNKLIAFCAKDSTQAVKYLVYEHSAIEYIMFNLNDTFNICKEEKDITVCQNIATGEIKSSLWNAMIDNDLNPWISNDLAEIYQWSIDFFDLAKGDKFKVYYDEMFVDDTIPVGKGNIYAAIFTHRGKDYYAISFTQDGIKEYFDENAQNLRKAFLKAPLKFSRVSSRFTNSRFHPVLKIYRPHHGVDYAAPTGTPVHSIGNGKVVDSGYKGGAGNMVKIKHNNTYTTSYMHLSKYGKGIHKGATVTQGQVIGYVGSTGLSSGPHLDYRVYKNGKPIDPLKMESPPAEPVKSELMPQFKAHKDSVLKSLKNVKYLNN